MSSEQHLDGRSPQCRNPIQTCRLQLLPDTGLGNHPAIPNQHHVGETEALLHLLDLGRQCCRVGRIAGKGLYGNRYALGRRQQSVDDLPPPLDPVSRVPNGSQRTGLALKCRRGNVVQHQRARPQMPRCQLLLDPLLTLEEPVHRIVEIILITARHRTHLTQRARSRRRAQRPGSGELRGGLDDSSRDHGGYQVSAPGWLRLNQFFQTQGTQCSQHRGNVSMGKAPDDLEPPSSRRWAAALLVPA